MTRSANLVSNYINIDTIEIECNVRDKTLRMC